MRVALGIIVAAVIAVGSAGAAVWQQTDRQLRTLRSSNAELRAYVADLGERFLELERGLDAVILQNSFEPQRFGGSVDLSRLYGYIRRSSSYTACLLEEQRRQFEEERRRDRAQATTGGRARDRVSGLGVPDVAKGSACTPP